MTRQVVTAGPSDTVRHAMRTLDTNEFRHLPIVEDGRLVGIISDRDLRDTRLPLLESLDDPQLATRLLTKPLAEVMETNVVTVGLEDELDHVVACMLEHRVGALPVLDHHDGSLVGIVSYIDLLRALRSTRGVGL